MKNQNTQRKRIFYLDALRCVAILTVITVHVFMPARALVLGDYGVHPSLNWFITDFFVCTRIGVDIFLMLAGALSLGRDWTIKSFLGKRIPRIVEPFIFWGIILSFAFITLSYCFPDTFTIVKTFDLYSLINFIINAFLANSRGFGPYWFFWMILGTYLIMPIFNKWLYHSNLKEAEYFLVFWLITCIFDFTIHQTFPIKLSYFTSPIGLVVLGYYLRHTERRIFKNLYVPIILILLGAGIILFKSYQLSTPNQFFWYNRYSIFMVMEVTGIYLLFKNIGGLNININFFKNPNGIFRKAVLSLAKYSYGVYLIHNFFITLIFSFLRTHYPNLGFKSFVTFVFFWGGNNVVDCYGYFK